MNALPAAAFDVPLDDQEFWSATERGILLLDHCPSCGIHSWYPRPFCPSCGGEPERVPAAGTGVVYSYTVVRKARGAFRELTPYVVAYVELTEGPRVLTNVIDCDPAEVRIGLPVVICFDEAAGPGSPRLYRFRPAAGQ